MDIKIPLDDLNKVYDALVTCQKYYTWTPNDKSICGGKVLSAIDLLSPIIKKSKE